MRRNTHSPSSGGTFLVHTPLTSDVHLRIEASPSSTSRSWCCAVARSRTATSALPPGPRILGVLLCGYLATLLSGRPARQFVIAGILLAVGVTLWLVNLAVVRRSPARAPTN